MKHVGKLKDLREESEPINEAIEQEFEKVSRMCGRRRRAVDPHFDVVAGIRRVEW